MSGWTGSGGRTRWLVLGLAPALLGGVLAFGFGTPGRGPAPAASATPAAPPSAAATPSAPAAPPASSAPPAAPAPPPVDPRVERALNTKVRLQAVLADDGVGRQASGAGGQRPTPAAPKALPELWTELRRLGVGLTWPDGEEPRWTLDERWFQSGLNRFARRVERMPRNARLMHQNGSFRAIPGRPGRRLDRDEARRQLLAALASPAFRRSLEADLKVPGDGLQSSETISSTPDTQRPTRPAKPLFLSLFVPLRPAAPTVTPAHLGSIHTPLATYSTSLGGSSRNRRHNIRLSCEAIDGTVLLPGQVFSYNDVVGPRSERAGYRTAPVIIRGELVPGTGGGICQVSTTLYNAALLADLKIVRRSHHRFPVAYVAPGRDATVAYGSLDLRFANSLPRPIMLDVKTIGSRVIGRVFGAPETKRDVRLISSRVTWTRPRVPASGGPARPGKRVTISRVVRLADGSARREVVSRDVYAPAPATGRSVRRSRRSSYRRSSVRRRSGRSPARSLSRSRSIESRPAASPPRSTAPPPTSFDSMAGEP